MFRLGRCMKGVLLCNMEETNMEKSDRGGFRNDRPPREMHKATCSECGEECEVPFKPTEGKPVYCRECYRKKRRF